MKEHNETTSALDEFERLFLDEEFEDISLIPRWMFLD